MSLHFTLYDERILNEGEMSCKFVNVFASFRINSFWFCVIELEINGGSNEDEEESEGEDEEE